MHLDETIVETSDEIRGRRRVDRAVIAVRIDHEVVVKELDLVASVFVQQDAIFSELAAGNVKFDDPSCPALYGST
jgi:hypothetical protein